jgi:hypothetical protein
VANRQLRSGCSQTGQKKNCKQRTAASFVCHVPLFSRIQKVFRLIPAMRNGQPYIFFHGVVFTPYHLWVEGSFGFIGVRPDCIAGGGLFNSTFFRLLRAAKLRMVSVSIERFDPLTL